MAPADAADQLEPRAPVNGIASDSVSTGLTAERTVIEPRFLTSVLAILTLGGRLRLGLLIGLLRRLVKAVPKCVPPLRYESVRHVETISARRESTDGRQTTQYETVPNWCARRCPNC